MTDYKKALAEWLINAGKVVIVGIGNPLRRDDAVGLDIIKKLVGKTPENKVLLIESESIPENYIEPIIEYEPSHILIIDAALLGLRAGSVRLTESYEISGGTVSTHTLPIQIFCNYLSKITEVKVALLLIQPENVDFGEGLSTKLERTVEEVAHFLTQILSQTSNLD